MWVTEALPTLSHAYISTRVNGSYTRRVLTHDHSVKTPMGNPLPNVFKSLPLAANMARSCHPFHCGMHLYTVQDNVAREFHQPPTIARVSHSRSCQPFLLHALHASHMPVQATQSINLVNACLIDPHNFLNIWCTWCCATLVMCVCQMPCYLHDYAVAKID